MLVLASDLVTENETGKMCRLILCIENQATRPSNGILNNGNGVEGFGITSSSPRFLLRKPCQRMLSLTFPSGLFLWRHREQIPAQFADKASQRKLPRPVRVIVQVRSFTCQFLEPRDQVGIGHAALF